MAMNQLARRAAELVRARIETQCPGELLEARVYGSMARGDAHDESDLDLLLITRNEDRAVRDAIFAITSQVEFELGFPFAISPCIVSEGRMRDLREREALFAFEIERDGIVV